MGVAWRAFFAALHVATIMAVWVLFWRQGIIDPAMYEAAKRDKAADALHFALQVGRLDIVSLMLAAFGIFAGIAAIFGFIEIRHRAKEAAKFEAKAEAKIITKEYLDKEAPAIIRAHVEFILPPNGKSDGDDVAAAYRTQGPPIT